MGGDRAQFSVQGGYVSSGSVKGEPRHTRGRPGRPTADRTVATGHARPASWNRRCQCYTLRLMKVFQAVVIVAQSSCCDAAKALRGQRKLISEVPRLPLDDCSRPETCHCRFEKHSDRRDGEDRRLFGSSERNAWYHGPERRKSHGRRDRDG